MKVWILTSEYNEYDQHGEYFEAVFAEKPTTKQIQEICGLTEFEAIHLLLEGGRKEDEYQWYNLREHETQ